MTPELIAEGVRLGLIAPDETISFRDSRPLRGDPIDVASGRRAWALHHTGGWPGPAPRSPWSGKVLPAPPPERLKLVTVNGRVRRGPARLTKAMMK